MEICRVGIDLAKKVFHLTAMDGDGNPYRTRPLRSRRVPRKGPAPGHG